MGYVTDIQWLRKKHAGILNNKAIIEISQKYFHIANTDEKITEEIYLQGATRNVKALSKRIQDLTSQL